MHPAIRKNNVLASNIYFVSCLFAVIRVAITLYTKLSLKGTGIGSLLFAMAILLAFYMGFQYLFGIGLRRGIMWVKVVFLTVTIIMALAYLPSLFGAASIGLHNNYDTPLKAVLLATEFVLSLWAVVVIFQGFGISDRVSMEAQAQPVAEESPDAGVAVGGYDRPN